MSRATRCSLRYKTRTVVFLYVTPFIWRKYQNIKWASILSLGWIEDLMMSFERTEETRSPELAPEASVALSGSSCESPVQCCYIHTIAFLNCLQPDCFRKVHVFKLVLASIRNWVSLHLFSCAAFTKPTSSRPLLFSGCCRVHPRGSMKPRSALGANIRPPVRGCFVFLTSPFQLQSDL